MCNKKRVNKLHGDSIQSIKWHGPQNKLPAACEEMNKWLKLQLLQKAKVYIKKKHMGRARLR